MATVQNISSSRAADVPADVTRGIDEIHQCITDAALMLEMREQLGDCFDDYGAIGRSVLLTLRATYSTFDEVFEVIGSPCDRPPAAT